MVLDMAVSLVDTLTQLEAMVSSLESASEASKDERKVVSLARKLAGSDIVPIPDSLATELATFIASHASADVDKSEGKAMAKRIGTYVAYCESEPEIVPSFDIAHAKSVMDAWAKLGGSVRGTGTGDVDAPGRVILEFAYPDGVDSVKQVDGELAFGTRVEQAVRNGSLRWEITRRAKALSGISEGTRGAYKWDEKSRDAWRAFFATVKDGKETQASIHLPVGSDGKAKLVVTATYKV